jgi:hypothetical protein
MDGRAHAAPPTCRPALIGEAGRRFVSTDWLAQAFFILESHPGNVVFRNGVCPLTLVVQNPSPKRVIWETSLAPAILSPPCLARVLCGDMEDNGAIRRNFEIR